MDEVAARLRDLLSKPVSTPSDAERAARAAEALALYLRAKEHAERFLDEAVAAAGPRVGDSLAGLTLDDAAERVLEDAGVALHADELGKRIKARGWRHPRSKEPRPSQIMHQLAARLPRDPRGRFRRVARNTFALTRWDDDPRPPRPKPRVALFAGPGGAIARSLDATPDQPAEADHWRSS